MSAIPHRAEAGPTARPASQTVHTVDSEPFPCTQPGSPGADRSYLLRVRLRPGSAPQLMLQDLKSGERREFTAAADLGDYLVERSGPGLR